MNQRILWLTIVVTLMLVSAACMPITPPAETPMPEEEATVMATTVPAEEPSVDELSGTLTGTVTYLQRVALPAGSVIEVQLQDVSLQDVAATVVASQTITTAGENVPIPFTLAYDPTQIDPRMTYALSVRITIEGELRWINTERYAVLTNGAPITGVEVRVQSAR